MISKALIDSYINHDESLSMNSLLRDYNKMEEEMRNPKNAVKQTI